jgi:hypothetical protein
MLTDQFGRPFEQRSRRSHGLDKPILNNRLSHHRKVRHHFFAFPRRQTHPTRNQDRADDRCWRCSPIWRDRWSNSSQKVEGTVQNTAEILGRGRDSNKDAARQDGNTFPSRLNVSALRIIQVSLNYSTAYQINHQNNSERSHRVSEEPCTTHVFLRGPCSHYD